MARPGTAYWQFESITVRVVIAPDSFKGVLDARRAAEAIARGVRRARPDAVAVIVPMADGGEGTLDVLVNAANGNRRRITTTGPMGGPLEVTIGLIHQASTAVIELASMAGYALVPAEQRDPLTASTYGFGEVIRATVEAEIEEVVLAVGGSATVDGGAGMMQALGMTFFDADGRPISSRIGGGHLQRVARFAWDRPPPNIEHVQFTIACDVLNPACGPNGAAAVFGPQKGADAKGVRTLDQGLSHWADLLEQACGRVIRDEPGTGAAGGVALPLLAFAGAALVPGVDLVSEAVGLAGRLGGADLVITGEGQLDRQSLMGKVVGSVGRMSRAAGVPCVAIVGTTGPGAEACLEVLNRVVVLDAPLDQTEARLAEAAERVVWGFWD
ncbi:MAG: glycerate kinase [Phycisphaerae bacterium]|nr:glycerate kinase [Phycisphaerae bacterium]